jgi:hypothetical protein
LGRRRTQHAQHLFLVIGGVAVLVVIFGVRLVIKAQRRLHLERAAETNAEAADDARPGEP